MISLHFTKKKNNSFFIHSFILKYKIYFIKGLNINILIYSNCTTELNNITNIISDLNLNINIDKTNNYTYIFDIYNKKSFDCIIIDNQCQHSKHITKSINEKNYQQKIILLNEKYKCEYSLECQHCENNFNTKVLIKPFKRNELIESIIQNFRCQQFQINEKEFLLKRIQKEISYEFSFVIYDDTKKQFILQNISNNFQITALIFITDKLTKNNINYEVCNNSEIIQLKL